MPSAAYVMVNWKVDMTWTPVPGTYSAVTRSLTFKAASTASAWVATMAANQTQDMNTQNPIILSAPYLDPDQSW